MDRTKAATLDRRAAITMRFMLLGWSTRGRMQTAATDSGISAVNAIATMLPEQFPTTPSLSTPAARRPNRATSRAWSLGRWPSGETASRPVLSPTPL